MQYIDCSRGWRFYEAEEGNSYLFFCPDGEEVDLPHDFIIGKERSADAPGQGSNGYFGNGEGVYRKTLDIPMEWEGKTVLLDVDGAYMNMEVSLNKEVLAIHPHGYTPFQIDLTGALRFDGRKNRLKIITQSRQPSTRWYSGGGLYRSVCLWVGGPVHIRPWDLFVTTMTASKESARLHVQAVVEGEQDLQNIMAEIRIEDADGTLIAGAKKSIAVRERAVLEEELELKHPLLWSPDHPNLYTCRVILSKGEEVLDEASCAVGVRVIEIDAVNGLRFNGKPMKLRGGCIHHDNGFLGACAYPKAEERKIRKLKENGYNTVRFSHYPPSRSLLEICDRLGMLLMDEAFDCWRLGKMPMDYHLYFDAWWAQDIEYMVKRDRSHPCVISYSIGNEINESNGCNHGPELSRLLSDKVREFDPTRPVLSAICGLASEADDEDLSKNLLENTVQPQERLDAWNAVTADFCAPLDVVGYNYLKDLYESSHAMFPERVILGTETFPFDTYDNWEKTKELPYVIGDCIWTAVDYLGETALGRVYWDHEKEDETYGGPYPWRCAFDADIDLTGEDRPQGIYRRIMWGEEKLSGLFTTHPMHTQDTFHGSHWNWYDVQDVWCFEDKWIGKPVKADVYTAGDTVEWILNGRSLGQSKPEKLIASRTILYEPGCLKAVCYKDGKVLSTCRLVTPGAAAKIRVVPEEDFLHANGQDLAYFRILLEDKDGNRLTQDKREIEAEVSRSGIFLAAGSADPCSEDHITANTCHLFRGSAIVIVKAKEAGTVLVSVRSREGSLKGNGSVEAI